MEKPAVPVRRIAGTTATRVMAVRLSEAELTELTRFGQSVGASAGRVLKLAAQALADGRVAIGAEEAGLFRAVAHELRQAGVALEWLEAEVRRTQAVNSPDLDNAFAKLLAVLAAFEMSARSFADRRQGSMRIVVGAQAQGAGHGGAAAS